MKRFKGENGFVLIDVVFGLFLFILGFAALYGLTEGAVQETQQVFNLTEAANHAQSIMEDLAAHPWSENLAEGRCIPGARVSGEDGRFEWQVYSEWEIPDELLRVQVEVFWQEKGQSRSYILDTLYSSR
jgi:hypothetical protein